jgi:4-aminobutyrate aminotransferase-like enzyme
MKIWRTNPFESLTLAHGNGCRVFDEAGRGYLDLLSGTWCNVLGHGHPRLEEAVAAQVSKLVHVGPSFLTGEVERALGKLSEIVPADLSRAVFLNTGSEAVEFALKIARAVTGGDEVVVLERSYYGATIAALSLSEAGRTAGYLPGPGRVHRLPAPDCSRCPARRSQPCREGFPCLDGLEVLAFEAERRDRRVAAVLFEPVLANAGVIVPPVGYGVRLRALATRWRVPLVAEEVTTGVGRTGRWFAFEHDSIVPDILVVGKALGGGLPVAAVVTTEEIEARCQGLLTHVQSHQNDPFSGRVAATVISIMQEERLVERAADHGRHLLEALRDLGTRTNAVREVRGRGLMIGIELTAESADQGPGMARRLLDRGFIVSYQPHNRAFRLFPPYVISGREIDAFLDAFRTVLAEAESRATAASGGAPGQRQGAVPGAGSGR